MNQYHQELLQNIQKAAPPFISSKLSESYSGSQSVQYHLPNPIKWDIAKTWAKQHRDISLSDFVEILYSLNRGTSHEEKTLVGMLLACFPSYRASVQPDDVGRWLLNIQGWAEIDNVCQNLFTYTDLLNNWSEWHNALIDFAQDTHIQRRRASLVLLTGPVNYSSDTRLSVIAFQNIERLQTEQDILISKAISWLLRSLIKNHRSEVEQCIQKHEMNLPKIAIRETRNKLMSGRKSGH